MPHIGPPVILYLTPQNWEELSEEEKQKHRDWISNHIKQRYEKWYREIGFDWDGLSDEKKQALQDKVKEGTNK
jgi:DNA phosphorothioation-dependent restriction protein DptG